MPVSGSRFGSIGDTVTALVEQAEEDVQAALKQLPIDHQSQSTGDGLGASAHFLSQFGHGAVTGDAPPSTPAAHSPAAQAAKPPAPHAAAAPPAPAPPPPPTPAPPPPAAAAPPPPGSTAPQPGAQRPAGDTRSADDIVNSNPTLKNLGNQSGVQDNLKKQVGDWTDPKLSPDQRADAAYRAGQVLDYIKGSNAADGSGRSANVGQDGKIDGFTKSGDARHGTEAGMLQDFGKYGYSALPASHNLPTTTDSHVNKDGTTQSNLQHAGKVVVNGLKKIGDGFLKVVKVVEDVASKVSGFVADLKIPGISEIAAAASVGTEELSQAANVGHVALEHGDVKAAAEQMGENVGETAFSALTAPGAGKALGEGAKAAAEAAKRAAKEGVKQAGSQGGQAIAANAGGNARGGGQPSAANGG